MSDSDCTLDIDCYVDSDWAGCRTTRKSTSGTVVQLLNSTVSFGSRTQGTIALSSGEAEPYAIGQGTSEALFVKNLITEAKLAKSVNITVHTDSTAGKSMAKAKVWNKQENKAHRTEIPLGRHIACASCFSSLVPQVFYRLCHGRVFSMLPTFVHRASMFDLRGFYLWRFFLNGFYPWLPYGLWVCLRTGFYVWRQYSFYV